MSLLATAYPWVRPLLFTQDAEQVHHRTLAAMQRLERHRATRWLLHQAVPALPGRLMGLAVRNPVGLAAGLDKSGACIDALGAMGFGFIEVGTVTPRPQAGNPTPRLFRLPPARALINRMGFNNPGLDAFIHNVQASHFRQRGGILGLNIGKNADTPIPQAADDYVRCLEAVFPHADYVTLNISSPNTSHLRDLQQQQALGALLARLGDTRQALADQHGRCPPLAVKIAPDLTPEAVDDIATLVQRHGLDGVIATNTTVGRDGVRGLPHANEAGGLSGPPVHAASLAVIARLRERLGAEVTIIGVGGIESGPQAVEKIAAGADAVQLYTGLVYRGPRLVSECARDLKAWRVRRA